MRWLFLSGLLAMLSVPVVAQDALAAAGKQDIFCVFAQQELSPDQARRFCATLRNEPNNFSAHLVAIDRALEQVDYRSPFNALLMTMRGSALVQVGNDNEAAKAFEQAIDLYPGAALILMSAVSELAYTSHTDQAAHYWIELAEVDPASARLIPGLILSEVVGRLENADNLDRAVLLVEVLDSVGYDGGDPFATSTVGMITMAAALNNRDVEAARTTARRIVNPDSLISSSSNNYYRRLWPDLGWQTPTERQTAMIRWADALSVMSEADSAQAGLMMSALLPHIGPEPLLAAYDAQLLDGLQTQTDQQQLFNLAFWLAPLAHAHVLQGDLAGAEQIYQSALEAFAPFDNPARFNADANYGLMLVDAGRYADALAVIEPAIEQLAEMDRSNQALLPMHVVRVRALSGLGQLSRNEASLSTVRAAIDSNFSTVVSMLLDIGRYEEARDFVLARLQTSNNYRAGLDYLQPSIEAYPMPAAIEREVQVARLRADPQVIAALAAHGRLLDQRPIRLDSFVLPTLDLTAVPPLY